MSWQNAPPPSYHQQSPPLPPFPFNVPFPTGMFHGHGDAGDGVDNIQADHGFQLGPGVFNAWSGPFGLGGTWGPRGPGGWGFGHGPGPRGGSGGRGGYRGRPNHHHHHHSHSHSRHRRENSSDEDLHDITAAAAAAEAEMEANSTTEGGAEKTDRSATTGAADDEHPDPPEEVPPPRSPPGRHGCRGRGRWRGRGRGRGAGFGFGFGPRGSGAGFDWRPHVSPGGPGFTPEGLREMVRQASDAIARVNQEWSARADGGYERDAEDDSETFMPPIDLFDTRDNWTIHVALPGAKRDDLGVHWDSTQSLLTVTGVVHRLGDEELLADLVSGERRVGLFERKIPLPPPVEGESGSGSGAAKGARDEVDGDNIQAKMVDGILIIVVPKVEKEWTEVKKIDVL